MAATGLEYVTIDPVGQAFLLHKLKYLWLKSKEVDLNELSKSKMKDSTAEEKESKGNEGDTASKDKKKAKKRKKKEKKVGIQDLQVEFEWEVDKEDLYAVLGMTAYEMIANTEDVKIAYKKIQALCHPDKHSANPELQAKAQERFKLLENAYETLSDPLFKKLYDSQIDFDDSIPSLIELNSLGIDRQDYDPGLAFDESLYAPYTGDDTQDKAIFEERIQAKTRINEELFYDYFQKYFQKFAIYSNNSNVPSLGNRDSSDSYVLRFYKFWDKFNSWRDFTHMCDKVDIYDLKYAENNSELKWMKKINEKKQAPFKLAEKKTISDLVQLCKERDPRLLRIEEKERYEFFLENKRKEERRLQRERERMAQEQKWEEERQRKLDEQARIEREKQREKDRMRHQLKQLPIDIRTLFNKSYFQDVCKVRDEDIDTICHHSNIEEFRSILDINESNAQLKHRLQFEKFMELLPVMRQRAKSKQVKEEKSKKENKSKKYGKIPWNLEELRELTRICCKYPHGTHDRWQVIYREFIKKSKSDNSKDRTREEVILTAKDLQKGKLKLTDAVSTSRDKNGSGTQEEVPTYESEMAAIRSKYGDFVKDEYWSKHQTLLEKALRELMPKRREKQWSLEKFWKKVSQKLNNEKSKEECEQRTKYVREVILCKKKFAKQ